TSTFGAPAVPTTVLPDLIESLMAFIWRRCLPQYLSRPFNWPTVTDASARHYRTLAKRHSLRVVPTGVASTMGQCQPFSIAHPNPPVRCHPDFTFPARVGSLTVTFNRGANSAPSCWPIRPKGGENGTFGVRSGSPRAAPVECWTYGRRETCA